MSIWAIIKLRLAMWLLPWDKANNHGLFYTFNDGNHRIIIKFEVIQ